MAKGKRFGNELAEDDHEKAEGDHDNCEGNPVAGIADPASGAGGKCRDEMLESDHAPEAGGENEGKNGPHMDGGKKQLGLMLESGHDFRPMIAAVGQFLYAALSRGKDCHF